MPTGRGQFVSDITPSQYDEVLASLYRIQQKYQGRMLDNAKCAPHYIQTVLQHAADDTRGGANGAEIQATDPWHERGGVPTTSASPTQPTTLPGIRTYSGGAGGCPAGTHYMGIRPNGDVTPCPYLPVFAGSLRSARLEDLWTSSELFSDIRRRASLGGRCGACEMNAQCGGCRARAYGMTGDLMAEDPLCTHTPGTFAGSPLLVVGRGASVSGSRRPVALEYGPESASTVAWDTDASARMKKIPAFVRGMVMRAVEETCRKNGLDRVTVEELERIRARMPTPKMFG